jgi:futalosine hydrolase
MSEAPLPACDVLVVAAHPVELAPLRAALAGDAGARGALRVGTQAVGVGLAVAGAGTARALQSAPARAVVLLGSFGAYPGSPLRIGSLLSPRDTRLIDEALVTDRAAAPQAMPVQARADAALQQGLGRAAGIASSGATSGTLATTAFITTDDALAATLARSGCVGENLEAVAVGLACQACGVPWAALLACTNEVGARGRTQWLAEHTRAAAQVCAALLAWLDQGAPGLAPITVGDR